MHPQFTYIQEVRLSLEVLISIFSFYFLCLYLFAACGSWFAKPPLLNQVAAQGLRCLALMQIPD